MKKTKEANSGQEKNLKGFEELLDYFNVSPRDRRAGAGSNFEGADFELYNKFVHEQSRQEMLADFFSEKLASAKKGHYTDQLINQQRQNRDKELEILTLEILKDDANFILLLEHLVDSAFAFNRPAPLP